MANIAIFGGSFNPVHMGHYKIVTSLINTRMYEKVLIVPAWQNPLKKSVPDSGDDIRFEMLQATFDELEAVTISDYEIKKREISYTYKTIDYFSSVYPNDRLFLVLGQDSFNTLPAWINLDQIAKKARFIIFKRTDFNNDPFQPTVDFKYHHRIEWRSDEIPDISATQIRASDLNTITQNQWLKPKAFEIWATHINAKNQK